MNNTYKPFETTYGQDFKEFRSPQNPKLRGAYSSLQSPVSSQRRDSNVENPEVRAAYMQRKGLKTSAMV
jgi:hypothetical protein